MAAIEDNIMTSVRSPISGNAVLNAAPGCHCQQCVLRELGSGSHASDTPDSLMRSASFEEACSAKSRRRVAAFGTEQWRVRMECMDAVVPECLVEN